MAIVIFGRAIILLLLLLVLLLFLRAFTTREFNIIIFFSITVIVDLDVVCGLEVFIARDHLNVGNSNAIGRPKMVQVTPRKLLDVIFRHILVFI